MDIKKIIDNGILVKATNTESLCEMYQTLEKLQDRISEIQNQIKQEVSERVDGVLEVGEYRVVKSRVYKKALNTPPNELIGTQNERFISLEYKINTQVVNEHIKQHRALPECVSEVYAYETLKIGKKPVKKEAIKKELNPVDKKAIRNFMDNFKK